MFFCASTQYFYGFSNSYSWFVNICIGFASHGPPLKDGRTCILLTLMDENHTLIDMVDITLQPCT